MSIQEKIVLQLRNAIAKGEYKPGERLKEVAIARRFNTSRTPIREALKKLEQEGFIRIAPNVGASVAEFSLKDVSDVYNMVIVLEGTAARFACFEISEEQINRLKEYQFLMEKAAGENNYPLLFQLNLQFHWLITESTKNRYLIEMRRDLRHIVDCFASFAAFIPGQVEATLEEHPRVVDAFNTKNPALAEFSMREHMEHAKQFLLGHIQEIKAEGINIFDRSFLPIGSGTDVGNR
jgi:DNA-binding GntR family transcriptional regulator